MKLLTKVSYKNLEGICQKGDILTLEVVRHEEDYLIHPILYGKMGWVQDNRTGKSHKSIIVYPCSRVQDTKTLPEGVYKICDASIAPKGSVKSWVLITKDGRRYPTSTIIGAIGYVPLSKIFDKI